MKIAFVIVTTFATTLLTTTWASAATLQDGKYTGNGSYQTPEGKTGKYRTSAQVSVSAAGAQLVTEYAFDQQNITVNMSFSPQMNGFFKVESQGKEVGSGYCMYIQCHYEMTLAGTRVEETLTFYQDHLYRVGSKAAPSGTASWIEALDAAFQSRERK